MSTAPPQFLTVAQVARMFQVSTHTVYRHLDAGRLPGAKVGGWRIRLEDAQAFFDALLHKPPVKPAPRPPRLKVQVDSDAHWRVEYRRLTGR